MRQYLVDELGRSEMEAIRGYLKERTTPSTLDEIFWLEIPQGLLSPLQGEHRDCGPHHLAIEVGKDFIKFEFLVRSRKRFRCECLGYATASQEDFAMAFARRLIQDLNLKT
jgi:hypothetical protein